jgi:hypothetical protein
MAKEDVPSGLGMQLSGLTGDVKVAATHEVCVAISIEFCVKIVSL